MMQHDEGSKKQLTHSSFRRGFIAGPSCTYDTCIAEAKIVHVRRAVSNLRTESRCNHGCKYKLTSSLALNMRTGRHCSNLQHYGNDVVEDEQHALCALIPGISRTGRNMHADLFCTLPTIQKLITECRAS